MAGPFLTYFFHGTSPDKPTQTSHQVETSLMGYNGVWWKEHTQRNAVDELQLFWPFLLHRAELSRLSNICCMQSWVIRWSRLYTCFSAIDCHKCLHQFHFRASWISSTDPLQPPVWQLYRYIWAKNAVVHEPKETVSKGLNFWNTREVYR